MSIIASELDFFKSSQTNSDGGTITATAITDNTLNNLFPDVTPTQSQSGGTDYRKIFVKNSNASLTWGSVVFWRSAATTSTTEEINIGLGNATDTDGTNTLTNFTSAAKVALISDGTDTRVVTIVGDDGAGNRLTETVTLTSAVEVLSANTYTNVYLIYPASTSSTRTITIKQGTGGTVRGTIGTNKISAITYFNVSSKATGLLLGNIASSASQGLWLQRVIGAGSSPVSNDTSTFNCEGTTT